MFKTVTLHVPPQSDPFPKRIVVQKQKRIMVRLKKNKISQRLRVLTVIWVDALGVPFNTIGFVGAIYTRNGVLLDTASFDNFGVVQFNRISTPVLIPLVVRTFNSTGVLFRTRTIPSGLAAFAIIG